MREQVQIERQIRLENFLRKIEKKSIPPHLVGRWTEVLINLYLGLIRSEAPDWPNSNKCFRDVFKRSGSVWVQIYVHTAVQHQAREALKKLQNQDYKAVRKILEKIASDEFGKEVRSKVQSHNASHKHKKRSYEKLLDSIFRANPAIGHKELYRELLKQVGHGVIQRIDDSLGEIVLEDERIFQVSGLKDQIYKRRSIL
jgi:hypothetical protein